MSEVKKGRKRRNKRKFNKILTVILLVVVLIFFVMMFYLNILPFLWTILALIAASVILFFLVIFNLCRIKGLRIIGYFFSILIIAITVFGEVYLYNTIGFLYLATNGNYALNVYNIMVLNDSNYDKLADLDNKKIGINGSANADAIKKMQKEVDKKIDVNYQKYTDSQELVDALIARNTDAIVLEDSELNLLMENNLDSYNMLKNIYKIEIKSDINDMEANKLLLFTHFSNPLFIIESIGVTFLGNKKIGIIILIVHYITNVVIGFINRDYYVNINNSSYKDKLTHAGIYGVNSSIYALEKLFDIDINYYVKVNFTSMINIVDVLGGITVYNDETFTTNENITFRKGYVDLDGERALSFVRDRKHVTGGDLGRGKNQVKVLEALMKKAMGKDIIKNYNKLLDSLEGSFVTNMDKNTMFAFIRKEMQSPRNWQIDSITLDGTDSYEYTYTYRNYQLYVMLPNKEKVNEAKTKIKSIIQGES